MSPTRTPSRREWIALGVILVVVVGLSSTWRERSQAQLGLEAARMAGPGDVRMLSSQSCPFCTRARAWFSAHDVAFQECFIEQDPACRAEFDALGAPGTPVLRVRQRVLIGFDPRAVVEALSRTAQGGATR